MPARISKWLVVCLLSATLGFHWDLLQSVAWVGMIVNYSARGTLEEAVSKTFDGRHPCPLCKLIHAGKSSEKKSDAQQNVNKTDLFADCADCFDFPALPAKNFPVPQFVISRTDAPLLRPPRPFFG